MRRLSARRRRNIARGLNRSEFLFAPVFSGGPGTRSSRLGARGRSAATDQHAKREDQREARNHSTNHGGKLLGLAIREKAPGRGESGSPPPEGYTTLELRSNRRRILAQPVLEAGQLLQQV